jgi:hypothetical protein
MINKTTFGEILTMNQDNFVTELLKTPLPTNWETIRRSVSSKAGRHAVIAGGALRDHILGLPVKDVDIFILGMSAQAAKEIFNADTVEYAGVEEAKHQYVTEDGLTVDLVFSRFDNVQEVLAHFDLGICRVAWDGNTVLATEEFRNDLDTKTATQFYPSGSGHAARVMAKLAPLGFKLKPHTDTDRYEDYIRCLAHDRGYSLMHRRNGQYWLMPHRPMGLVEIAEKFANW